MHSLMMNHYRCFWCLARLIRSAIGECGPIIRIKPPQSWAYPLCVYRKRSLCEGSMVHHVVFLLCLLRLVEFIMGTSMLCSLLWLHCCI